MKGAVIMSLEGFKTLSEAKVGESFARPVFIKEISEIKKEGGNTHLRFTLLDGCTEESAMLFSTTAAQAKSSGIVRHIIANASIKVSDYNGKSFNIQKIVPYGGDDLKIDDFVVTPPIDIELMYNEMTSKLKEIGDDMNGTARPISELALDIIRDNEKHYKHSSAAVKVHHNFKGGLIYHSYRMFKGAEALCGVYHELDRELLMSAAAIHDIGKMWEYKTDIFGSAEYSAGGVLFGHLYMGAKLVSNYAEKYDKEHPEGPKYNEEKLKLLIHMILSHHGKHEWGAVVVPAIPEAYVLHYLDNIDAKLNVCEKEYPKLAPGAVTQSRPFTFDGNIYKATYNTDDERGV